MEGSGNSEKEQFQVEVRARVRTGCGRRPKGSRLCMAGAGKEQELLSRRTFSASTAKADLEQALL